MKYGLAGSGGTLEGLVAQDHIKLDMRLTVASDRAETDYPWIVFRRAMVSENNQVQYTRDSMEFELIGLRSSASKGDDTLETVRLLLIDAFSGKHRTFGKYLADGTPDPAGGLKMRASYVDTRERFDAATGEKSQFMVFLFTFVRQ